MGEDEDARAGNYFGRAAAAPAAPPGANPFASTTTPDDDVAAMIALAKKQCEERKAEREREEAADRERERKAFEDRGATYEARRKPGDAVESPSASASVSERRKPVKARRPGASPLGGGATANPNAFAGFAALTRRDATKPTDDASRASVFSRLSGARANAAGEETKDASTKSAKPSSAFPALTTTTTEVAAKPAGFGFFAPPPELTKDNVDTQRTIKQKKTIDDENERNANATRSSKKMPTALAVELGLDA